MKFFFRWLFRLLVLLIVLLVAGVLLLDTIVREIAEYRISNATGLEVKIGSVNVGILNPRVTVEHLVLYNNADFGGSPLLDMPELHAEYVRPTLFSPNPHFRLIRFNLARLNVVEDTRGNVNLDVLQKRLQSPARNGSAPSQKNTAPIQFPRIDTLNLSLGRATYRSMKQPNQVDELKMDIRNQVLTNVVSGQDLAGVATAILLRNGVNPMGNSTDPTNHWLYWMGRLTTPAKK